MSTARKVTLVLSAAFLTTMMSAPSFAGLPAPVAVGYGAGSAGNTFVHIGGTQNIYLMILSGAFFF